MKLRFFLYLSYNGSRFCGWQMQNNADSVQQTLTQKLSLLLKEDISLTGAGRTDTGVHASFFVAHFDTVNLGGYTLSDFLHKANSFLGNDIHLFDIRQVQPDAHARFDATSRTYEYYISGTKDPFKHPFRYKLPLTVFNNLDVGLMNKACEALFNYTDFSSFSKVGTQTKTNNCHIFEATVFKKGEVLIFRIKADRFLRNMVRAIAGTLLDVGMQKISIADFCQIIESKNRSMAGMSAPAKGLFLTHIEYPDSIFSVDKSC